MSRKEVKQETTTAAGVRNFIIAAGWMQKGETRKGKEEKVKVNIILCI